MLTTIFRRSKSTDSWKYTTNFYNNSWNKQLFGQVRKKERLREDKKEHVNLSPEIGTEVEDPICAEEANFWTSRSATLTQIVQTSTSRHDHLKQDEFCQSVAEIGTLTQEYKEARPEFSGCEDLMLAEGSAAYTNQVKQINEKGVIAKKVYSQPAKKQVPKDQFHPQISPLLNPAKPVFKLGQILLGKPTIRLDRDSEQAKGKSNSLPSVTSILKKTQPIDARLRLQVWEEKMIAEMGREKFEQMQKTTLLRGERLHYIIDKYLATGSIDNLDIQDFVSQNHVKSMSHILDRFARPPVAVESSVVHPTLNYKGYLDCVTMCYDRDREDKSHVALIDWKTSAKAKKTLSQTFDNPLQIAAYIGAFNHDDRYPIRVQNGLIVVVYNDGTPADLLPINTKQLEKYWYIWLQRLRLFNRLSNEE